MSETSFSLHEKQHCFAPTKPHTSQLKLTATHGKTLIPLNGKLHHPGNTNHVWMCQMLWHLENLTYFLWLNFLLFPENQPLQHSQQGSRACTQLCCQSVFNLPTAAKGKLLSMDPCRAKPHQFILFLFPPLLEV